MKQVNLILRIYLIELNLFKILFHCVPNIKVLMREGKLTDGVIYHLQVELRPHHIAAVKSLTTQPSVGRLATGMCSVSVASYSFY